ncbi:hypothetical protein V6U90_22705 [Micromonospora sp. CPCC 206060]|uniref:hypothetical protein n=1 Tax=Micromonospora sp. CPCC 206060 TaxID=3122406 RepID=UPI002FF37039
MPQSASQLLTKALHLLDRGETARGEAVLRAAVVSAAEAADGVTIVAALCCLGELLAEQDRRVEAVDALRSCLAVPVSEDLQDVCAAEQARARHLLAGMT